jgi:hypothetical protein
MTPLACSTIVTYDRNDMASTKKLNYDHKAVNYNCKHAKIWSVNLTSSFTIVVCL